jgi:hypothetical protein
VQCGVDPRVHRILVADELQSDAHPGVGTVCENAPSRAPALDGPVPRGKGARPEPVGSKHRRLCEGQSNLTRPWEGLTRADYDWGKHRRLKRARRKEEARKRRPTIDRPHNSTSGKHHTHESRSCLSLTLTCPDLGLCLVTLPLGLLYSAVLMNHAEAQIPSQHFSTVDRDWPSQDEFASMLVRKWRVA